MSHDVLSTTRDGRVAVIAVDLPGRPVNLLTVELGNALAAQLDALAADPGTDAVVIISGKTDTFIAGADIEAFVALSSREAATALSRGGQALMDRVAAFPKPLVVAIHGACLGGGLELALAATARIASDADVTRLGLPEVQLGLIPGAGGCQRLPRLVGLRAALDLILTGRRLRPSQAGRNGLVDDVVPAAILRTTAVEMAAALAAGRPPARRPPGLTARVVSAVLDGNPIGRALVFRQARRSALAKTGGHYPAPVAALDAVRTGLSHGLSAGLAREAELFGELAVGPVSRHLVQLFRATTALKKDPGVRTDDPLPAIQRVGIVGAGFMGASIAGTAVLRAGVDVRLKDTDWPRVARGLAAARRLLDEAKSRRRLDRHEHRRRVALLGGAPDDRGLAGRDLVIEAVFEDLAVKREVIAAVERVVPARAVIATNTSTLPIARLQEGAAHPERIVGLHFFSPVDRMPLVEVIPGPATRDDVTVAALTFGQRMGKTAIVVRDSPGFWVNRVLAPYLNEAGWLLDEGAPVESIDAAMIAFGFPVGPLALLDEVGLDVADKAAGVLHDAFGDRLQPAPAVGRLVADGRTGRKSGGGFYQYSGGKRGGPDMAALAIARPGAPSGSPPSAADVARRPVLMLLNEAARALDEGVVGSPRDGDIGAVMGFGFPPFRGGPFRYLDTCGAAAIVGELEAYAARQGPRFTPAPALVTLARGGATFYG